MAYPTLKDFPTVAMTSEQSDLLLRLMMVAKGRLLDEVQADSLDDVGFLGKVFSRRLAAHGVRVHIGAALFVLSLQETPGDAVMWAWTLFNMQRDDDHVISLSDVCLAFPKGFPTPDAYSACWDAQKVGGANALDKSETWVRKQVLCRHCGAVIRWHGTQWHSLAPSDTSQYCWIDQLRGSQLHEPKKA